MADPELDAIRQQRLAQLQSQYKVNYQLYYCRLKIHCCDMYKPHVSVFSINYTFNIYLF